MREELDEVVAPIIIRRCVMDNFRGFQTKTRGYCRSFLARYYDYYYDDKGEKVYRNMQILVRGFNKIARFMKDEFLDGETTYSGDIYVAGSLETYDDSYGVSVCITVINIKHMIKLPIIGGL